MKNNQFFKLLFCTILIFGLHSCAVEETITEEPVINFPDPVEILNTNLMGSLEDELGLPVSNAVITCSNCLIPQTTISNKKGDFQFLNVDVKGDSGYITVSSEGKFDAFRRIALLKDQNNYTRILIKDKVSLGTLSASEGGQLNHQSKAKISLPAGGIVDENGLTHNGAYEVFLSWIDPSSEELNASMMGDLSAIASDGELVGLSTFGMLQVELESPEGTSLNLMKGASATLEFPIPESLRSAAPSVIPLWSYDEENGYWVEEGQAILVDDRYVGEVSHFSTWNVDVKIDPVDICGSIVVLENGRLIELPYFQVLLSGGSFPSIGGWTNEDGGFRFINVPSGEVLTLRILNYCGDLVAILELGPYEPGKVVLEPIVIDNENEVTVLDISGSALNCDGLPVTNGCVSVELEHDSYVFPVESDGTFSTSFPTCGEFQATLQIIDKDGFALSLPVVLTEQSDLLELEGIVVCGEEPEEYISFTYLDPIQNIQVDRYYFDEDKLEYRSDEITPGDERYLLTTQPNGEPVKDGIGITITMIPEVGVDQSCSGVVILKENDNQFSLLNNLNIQFTDIGPETSPGVFEYIEGTFSSPGEIDGAFRLKYE